MKKFFTMLVIFSCIFFTTSFATTFVIKVDKTSIADTVVASSAGHNGLAGLDGKCEVCGGDHSDGCGCCTACKGNHWKDGKFWREPVCDCPEVDTIPSGYNIVRTWTATKDHHCNNDTDHRQTTQHHVITYAEAVRTCNHSETVCSKHGKTASAHGSGSLSGYRWTGVSSDGTCSNCNKSLYTGKCEVISVGTSSSSTSSSYTPTPSSPSTSSTNKTTPSPSCSCTPKCIKHYKNESQHPVTSDGETYYWGGVDSGSYCKACGGYRGAFCYPAEPQTTEDPTPCPHINVETEYYESSVPDGGYPASTYGKSFQSTIDTIESYRRAKPYNVGDDFTIIGNGHIDADIKQGVEESYTKTSSTRTWCLDCGEELDSDSGSETIYYYIDYKSNPPTYIDTYHSVKFSFEGFEVDGKESIEFNPKVVEQEGQGSYPWNNRPSMKDSSYSSKYIINKINTSELKEDDGKYGDKSSGMYQSTGTPSGKSGLLYGYAYVSCSCGCTNDRYRIYFDLTPPPPPVEEEYTLTLKAEGAPTTGGVRIDGITDDYKDYTQKTSPIGDGFTISAKANAGYEFDGWYKLDGSKYSEKDVNLPIVMPGYNLTLIAKFKPTDRYNVTVYSDGNGEVKFSGKYDDGQEGFEIYANVVKGDNIDIIATPNENYVVDYWERITKEGEKGPELGKGKDLTIPQVREDYIIFVHFKPTIDGDFKRLSTDKNGPGYVIGGTNYAIVGQDYPIWAFPIGEAEFKYWKEDSTRTITDFGRCDIVKMPDKKAYDLTAYFVDEDDDTYHQVIVKGDGNGDISINDEAPRSQDTTTVEDGTKITINAYPDDGFEFDKWTDEDGNVIPGGPKLTVTIDEDKIYIAHFEYTGEGYTLKVESAGGGKVRGNVDDAIAGKEYPIKAIPNEDCEFLYWENKETGEITDYADYDYVIMPDEDVTLVAHFREIGEDEKDKFYLTLKTQGSGTVSGEGWYKPDEDIIIVANPGNGYEFVGWYEDNLLVSTVEKYPPIKMPYYNMTLTAVFKLAEDNSESSPFKILSIRDVRWKDYFTGNGTTTNNELYVPSDATKNTVLVDSAKLIDNSYDKNRDIVYGYAVEFELVTTGVSRNQSNLSVIPTLYEKTSSGRLNKININLGKEYGIITSAESKDIKDFMITWEEKSISMKNNQTAPQVTWRWVWYLPLDIYEDICGKVGNDSDVVVNFEIYVNTVGGPTTQRFDYVKAINYLNRSDWGGNVFTYRLDKTLLEDIYDNANN